MATLRVHASQATADLESKRQQKAEAEEAQAKAAPELERAQTSSEEAEKNAAAAKEVYDLADKRLKQARWKQANTTVKGAEQAAENAREAAEKATIAEQLAATTEQKRADDVRHAVSERDAARALAAEKHEAAEKNAGERSATTQTSLAASASRLSLPSLSGTASL